MLCASQLYLELICQLLGSKTAMPKLNETTQWEAVVKWAYRN